MVAHLDGALGGPINELEQRLLDATPAIERWFRLEWMEHTPPFYCAVDVRNAGFKLAPMATSLSPDGWNNLAPAALPLAVQAAMAAIEKICPEARNLLIVPENQVRTPAYLSSLAQLRRIFHMAGLNVRVGSISPDIRKNTTLELPGGDSITLEPAQRVRARLVVKDFDPCTILLNNELAIGVPGILEDLHQQYLLPPLHASGGLRRLSTHVKCYDELCKRFGKLIGVDHWLISPQFEFCSVAPGAAALAPLAERVDALLGKIRKKHKEFGIKDKPFVLLRSNCGPARLESLLVRDASELHALPAHAPCDDAPSGAQEWLLREGVSTLERVNGAVAEPVVYLMDRYVVGGFYRVHTAPSGASTPFPPDASYVPLAFADGAQLPQPGARPGASAPNRFYMYGVIARLAMLAASYELEATDPQMQDMH